MQQIILAGALTVALAGCASVINDDEYNNLISQAENEIKLANKTGFLWLHTEKFLTESRAAKSAADKADKEGNRTVAEQEFKKAMSHAKTALAEARLAQQQAKDNANPETIFK
jgi:uncharacterized membrane protein YccC